jgi:hypothetical protein
MEAFGHLSVLISIILGLAITQVLQGVRGVVLARKRIRMYWVPLGWAAVVLLACVQSWWAIYGLRGVRDWTFLEFAVVLLQVIASYMQAAFVLPDFTGDEPIDLRAHYYDHVRWFFGATILLFAASLMKDLTISGALPPTLNLSFHLALMGTSFIAMLTRREWYHRANVVVAGLGISAYIVILFMRLQ